MYKSVVKSSILRNAPVNTRIFFPHATSDKSRSLTQSTIARNHEYSRLSCLSVGYLRAKRARV